MPMKRKLVAFTITVCLSCPGLIIARDCDPPEHEPWDWEEVPYGGFLRPGDGDEDCGGEAPVGEPGLESFYGDVLPTDLKSFLYAVELDTDDLTLALDEELAVFQLRGPLDNTVLTVLLRGAQASARYKVVWKDDAGNSYTVTSTNVVTSGDFVTVSWVVGEGLSPGALKVTTGGSVLVDTTVANAAANLAEARLGVVDASRSPASSAGTIRFFPRAKYWDF